MRRFAYRSMKKKLVPAFCPKCQNWHPSMFCSKGEYAKLPAADCVAITPFKFSLAECGLIDLLAKSREQMRSLCSHLLMLRIKPSLVI